MLLPNRNQARMHSVEKFDGSKSAREVSTESGMIHIFAVIAVIVVMYLAYTNIQGYVDGKIEERKVAQKAQMKEEVLDPIDATMRVDGERYRVITAFGLAPTQEELLAKIPKMSEEERAVAQQKLGQIIKQPNTVPLENMIGLAYARWGAVKEFIEDQPPAAATK